MMAMMEMVVRTTMMTMGVVVVVVAQATKMM